MADLKTYPVKSRIRRSGVVYEPQGERAEIELDEAEALRLKSFGCIGEALDGNEATGFDLKVALLKLIGEGHDIKAMNMADLGKLLGANARGVKRRDVDAALAEIEQEASG